ncbi:hypothetical protein [Citrobacter freundii]|uniref:hypothetical protein n=1 Tax=Citrobacter freundii TaxID=546 RepID=UPI00155EC041|nr:hypothetical protein [Citrobacter freundii]
MNRKIFVSGMIFFLSGCYEPLPSKDKAIETAKEEVSMALCGDRTISCVFVEGGNAHIGERRSDKTAPITVTFSAIKAKYLKDGSLTTGKAEVDEGLVVYDFDANTGDTYVKEISLWSSDGKRKIELCGHDYKFCKK